MHSSNKTDDLFITQKFAVPKKTKKRGRLCIVVFSVFSASYNINVCLLLPLIKKIIYIPSSKMTQDQRGTILLGTS